MKIKKEVFFNDLDKGSIFFTHNELKIAISFSNNKGLVLMCNLNGKNKLAIREFEKVNTSGFPTLDIRTSRHTVMIEMRTNLYNWEKEEK